MLSVEGAAMLVPMVFVLVQLTKKLVPRLAGAWLIGASVVWSAVTVVLVAQSDFAAEQVIAGKALDVLNGASQALVAIQVAGLTVLGATLLTQIGNIGQNNDRPL